MKIYVEDMSYFTNSEKKLLTTEYEESDVIITDFPRTNKNLLQKIINNLAQDVVQNFSGIDFRGIDFKENKNFNKNLQECNFEDCNLSGLDLSGIDFDGASFARSNLSGANLAECSIENVLFSSAELKGCNFYKVCGVNYNDIIDNSNNYIEDLVFSKPEENEMHKTKRAINVHDDAPTDIDLGKEFIKDEEISFSTNEIKKYSTYLPILSDIARKGLKKIIRWALQKFGKSRKVINNYIEVAMDALETYKDEANQLLQLVIGFVASQMHRVKNLGSISENAFLKKLSSNNLRKFGVYAMNHGKGNIVGELINKIVQWCTEKLMGSSDLLRIASAMEDPKALTKLSKELDKEEKSEEDSEAESEAAVSLPKKKAKLALAN